MFLKRHWQKLPLLVRGAVPNFSKLLGLRDLIALARRDECDARLVVGNDNKREVIQGPLRARLFRELPERDWTLLVHGVNHAVPSARQLLSRFSFLPHARLDDLMVSYAAPGGGVGAHFDSYDVFLLQGSGQRSWQVSAQRDLDLVADSELKILKRFRPTGSCIVGTGDMLYLPPRYAHNGVALDACFTYSIGFKAPEFEELKSQFLAYLDDCIQVEGRYQDPGLTRPAHAGEISGNMIAATTDALSRISWNRATVVDFVGRYLSEPKQDIVLHRPPQLGRGEFLRRVHHLGVELHPAMPLLFRGARGFINGDAFHISSEERKIIVALADRRRLTGPEARKAHRAIRTFHDWYAYGYLSIGTWVQQ